jgi:lipoprotein-anchoring transpeptidase ErfK/SrfK
MGTGGFGRSKGAGRLAALVGAALLLIASGTIVGLTAAQRGTGRGATPAAVGPAAVPGAAGAPRITITPHDGAAQARPDLGVLVAVADGTLHEVVVRPKGATGDSIPGGLSSDRTSWRTRWTLAPGSSYAVRATATSANGKAVTASSTFTTMTAPQTIAVSDVTPNAGETVGVGMPIVVSFDRAVRTKDQVERALEVRATKPAQGAWRWLSDQQVAFRTRRYWRPHQQVTLIAHLAGVRAAKNVYGTRDATVRFRVGDANFSRVDTRTHRMIVTRNGKRVRDVGISAGRGGKRIYTTTNGIHAVMGKASPVVMTSAWMGVTDPADPRYYKTTVYDAVQISNSGEYVHSAPWSLWAQGNTNVSHGCVNASPAFAAWFYRISQRGDIVTVTGTDRQLEWDNGYGYWQLPFKQWLQGSALGRPVTTAQAAGASAPSTSHAPAHD